MTALRSRRPRSGTARARPRAAHGGADPRAARLRVRPVLGRHAGAAALRAPVRRLQAGDRRARGLLSGGDAPGLAARWMDRNPRGGAAHHGGRPAAVHRRDRRVRVRLEHRGPRRAAVRPGNRVRLHLGRRPGVGDRDLAPRAPRRDARFGARLGDLRHAGRPTARHGGGGGRDRGRVRVRRRRVARADGVDAPAPGASSRRARRRSAAARAGERPQDRARLLDDPARGRARSAQPARCFPCACRASAPRAWRSASRSCSRRC